MVRVIAVKSVKWGLTKPKYDSALTLGITVNVKSAQLAGYVELKLSITLTVICVDGGPPLSDIVDWITKPFSGGQTEPPAGKDVETWIGRIGEHIKPRRIKVADDTLVYCEVSFEVDMTIGQSEGTVDQVPGSVNLAIEAATFNLSAKEVSFFAVLTTEETPSSASSSSVPHLRLGLLSLGATYSPKTPNFTLSCDAQISLTGKDGVDSNQALLPGSLTYMRTSNAQGTLARKGILTSTDSSSSWKVSAGIQGLQVGTLYELFDADSRDGVLNILGHVEISWLDFIYNYSDGKATDFTFNGTLLLGPLELTLDYHYPSTGRWEFSANLTEQPGISVTLDQLIADLQNSGSTPVVLPDFVGNIALTAQNTGLELAVHSSTINGNPAVFVVVDLKIADFEVLFVQFQEKGQTKPKRLFRAAITGLGEVNDVPIIDKMSQPFDDMPGAHFVVAITVDNVPTAVLDNGFTPDKKSTELSTAGAIRVADDAPDPGSGQAPLKKTIRPLTLSNIGLQYKDGSLGILLDATFKLGPIELELIGFQLMVSLKDTTISSKMTPHVSINGLSVSFNEPPTSMAEMFAKLSEGLYAGGLTVSFAPYALTAAGAYGTVTDSKGNQFKTVAVFAQLQGPLIELEFPQVSGVTLGFGYNSHLTLPTVDTISLVVVEFSSSLTLGVYASAVAQFPTTSPAILYAELGLVATIDFSAGSMIIQAKLSPASYILNPSCHLTGDFALGYWFGSNAYAGDFVFTIGGYHPAYSPPAHYPSPPPDRLAISWSLDGCLSISGQAYAAGEGGVSVHVEFTLDLWIVTIHIDVEIGAALRIWGPAIAGTVHVDFWVFGFDVNFGSSGAKPSRALQVQEFYQQVLLQGQDATKLMAANDGNQHTVTCVKGLMPDAHGKTKTVPAATWNVRGGVFAFSVKSVFPFTSATIDDGGQVPVPPDVANAVYSKPMWRTETEPLDTTVTISIYEQVGGTKETIKGFQVAGIIGNLPTAVWGEYTIETDPMYSPNGNQIGSLLNGNDPTVSLLNGLIITAPKPNIDIVNDGEVFNQYNVLRCNGPWDPVPMTDKVAQCVVERTWLNPSAGPGAAQKAVEMWAKLWAGPGESVPQMMGEPPKRMLGANKSIFELDYLEAPMVSIAH
ncbi:hypothetical protein B0T25DRAFT_599354 [Lasiosphaeria hispida]|uniref:DUF6603 domain-containing protein n=1 Tax=Lasiosphaeria hispida TaxID=260671 RepID=A0AAJ0H5C7_9PEZI|nr:hypothetical protein B0T25DRAFT_599354 [Lasiosphaeria hispida]